MPRAASGDAVARRPIRRCRPRPPAKPLMRRPCRARTRTDSRTTRPRTAAPAPAGRRGSASCRRCRAARRRRRRRGRAGASGSGRAATRVKPHRPMPTRVTPTMRSLHDDSASIGSAPRRASASRPTASTPPECPRPHRKPARQARPRPPASGATAARWSGPERTWIRPAVSPASVAASIAGIVSRVATRTGPWPPATIWPGQR